MGASPLNIETYELRTGDALRLLRELPDHCIQTILTSSPYYALRAYGTPPQVWDDAPDCEHQWGPEISGDARGGSGPSAKAKRKGDEKSSYGRNATRGRFCETCGAWEGELGLEPSPALFVQHLVHIFREVKRVLRKDGTLFLNIADTFFSGPTKGFKDPWGLKKKDLCGVPQRLVLALQEDGWFWRTDGIWSKAGGNCPRCHYRIEKGSTKPESVRDRFTRSHEYLYLLSPSSRYYFDVEAVKAEHTTSCRRDVFHISSQNFRGAHYATMPLALAEIAVLGGTSAHGACAKCRAPYKRVTQKGKTDKKKQKEMGGNVDGSYHGENLKDYEAAGAEKASDLKRRILAGSKEILTVGWEQTCKCKDPGDPVPCLVGDPFSGAATTGAVALRSGRTYLGLELLASNNVEIAKPRLDAVLEDLKAPIEIEFLSTLSGVYHGAAEILLHRVVANSVRLILTDPPYNVSRVNNFHTMNREGINFSWDGDFDQELWVRLADKALMPGGSIVIWNDWKVLGLIAHLLMDMGYDVKRNLTWIKTNPWPRNKERCPIQRTEVGLWAVKPGAKWVHNLRPHHSYEDLVFSYGVPKLGKKKKEAGRSRHETKKPDDMFREIVQIFSNPGELVLDPFAGGGTTAYACEAEGRRHISFELDEKWYEESLLHREEGKSAKPLKFATTNVEKAREESRAYLKLCKELGVDPITFESVEELDPSVSDRDTHQFVDEKGDVLRPAPAQSYKHTVNVKGL